MVFLAIISSVLAALGIVTLVLWRRSRRARELTREAEERHEARVAEVLDRRRRREAEHAEQVRAHQESVAAARSAVRRTTMAYSFADLQAQARRKFIAAEPRKIERELWTGDKAQAAGFPNNFLANAASVEDLGSKPLVYALAELTQYLADSIEGRGMIHCTPYLLSMWAAAGALRREGTVWLDAVLNGPRSGAGTVHRLPAGAAAQVLQAAAAPPI